MAKKEAAEETQAPEGASEPEQKATEAPAKKAPAYAGPRKAHWPEGFTPTGDEVADTKRLLELGPKTQFMIPMSPDDLPGATEMVQINGYKLTIMKGAMVEIPVPMANLLAEKYKVDMSLVGKSIASAPSKVRDAVEE